MAACRNGTELAPLIGEHARDAAKANVSHVPFWGELIEDS
jgi:hypothetical protein